MALKGIKTVPRCIYEIVQELREDTGRRGP